MISLQGGLPEVGDLVADKYRLIGVLGRGGMGVVFDADHELLERRVALKVLAPEVSTSAEAVARFLNEARAAARIASDRVVGILDVGTLPSGLPYMVMERLEGIDLGQLVAQEGRLEISVVVDLLVEAIEGVSHAHLEGIIHRDLKPSNLFLARRSDRTQVVKVLDFGISKLTGPGRSPSGSMTATSAILGSPYYMSPEQLRSSKTIDQRADGWSLGVIAHEMLTRTLPFEGDNLVELFAAIQERDAPPLALHRPDIPAELDAAVRRCLRRSPDDRFATAYAFGKALVPFGGAKARAALERLEAHISSKGGTVAELCSTEPAPRVSAAPAPLAHAPTLRSDARISGRSTGQSTSAPWSMTGGRSTRTSAIGLSALAVVVTLAAGIGIIAVVRARTDGPASHAGGASVEPTSDAATAPALLLSTSEPRDASAGAATAIAPETPRATPPEAPAPVAHDHPRPPRPAAHSGTPAPDAATKKRAPNPLDMNAL